MEPCAGQTYGREQEHLQTFTTHSKGGKEPRHLSGHTGPVLSSHRRFRIGAEEILHDWNLKHYSYETLS